MFAQVARTMVRIDPTVLEQALSRAREARRTGVVVFDLDSTLLDNRPRQARILREFGGVVGSLALEAAQPEHWEDWDIQRAMRNAGVTDEELVRLTEPAKQFWRERFFTSEYCIDDEAIAGAAQFVSAVRAAGAQVVYCTGRHEPMRAGSVACFQRLGFPVPGAGVHLFMKPDLELSDDDWKATAYSELRALGRVVAVFDNEPTHVNGYRRAFPDALVVHLATDHSGRDVPLADGIPSVRNFL
jgi:hypothetical protein